MTDGPQDHPRRGVNASIAPVGEGEGGSGPAQAEGEVRTTSAKGTKREKRGSFQRRLADLGFRDYGQYLQGAHWVGFRRRWYARNPLPACFACGERGRIELHHRTYKRLGCENYGDVVPLCRACHQEVHELIASGEARLYDAARTLSRRRRGVVREPRTPARAPVRRPKRAKKSPTKKASLAPHLRPLDVAMSNVRGDRPPGERPARPKRVKAPRPDGRGRRTNALDSSYVDQRPASKGRGARRAARRG